ncbi:MAG: acyltransferase [Polaromonas sp. 24-62-144]|nr:MAG: acyltransferase [Polaromonas sp. 24-62-144]
MSLPDRDRRLPGIDTLKGLACLLIVWHHLAFYGPMSDVVHRHAPWLTSWLYDYGRMAVQVFLVVGGFLAAASLAPLGVARFSQPGRLIVQRYRRLLPPYLVAIAMSVLVAAWVRPWFDHASVPAAPTLLQAAAHALLLQELGMALLLSIGAASLLVFNRHGALDSTALYFVGSYALGMLAFWASSGWRNRRISGIDGAWSGTVGWLPGVLVMAAVGALALWVDFRARIAVAVVVAFGLVALGALAAQRHASGVRGHGFWQAAVMRCGLVRVGQMAYSIFLIHFPVCLLVNALVSLWWPGQLLANVLGLLAAFSLSLLAGGVLYRQVETRTFLRSATPAPA